ncbi:RNase P/RNase MRP complex subunit [Halocaridina rubra]|uniref:Ribonuclease P protein subunit p29 n=1 Tax=Halocaridina rubra TaxID=373956 RepID=A0AAN9A230_HALRR
MADSSGSLRVYQILPSDVVENISSLVEMSVPVEDKDANSQECLEVLRDRLVKKKETERYTESYFECQQKLKLWPHKYKKKLQKNAADRQPADMKSSRKRKTALTSQERRTLGLHKINKLDKTFEMFVPLNKLWMNYAKKLLSLNYHLGRGWTGADRDNVTAAVQNGVRKIEYVGCFLRVTKSRCSSYIGVVGIVLKETKNTFTLICPDDKVRVIPKLHSEFSFMVENVGFSIFGSHLNQKPSVRAKNIFKKHCLWL